MKIETLRSLSVFIFALDKLLKLYIIKIYS